MMKWGFNVYESGLSPTIIRAIEIVLAADDGKCMGPCKLDRISRLISFYNKAVSRELEDTAQGLVDIL